MKKGTRGTSVSFYKESQPLKQTQARPGDFMFWGNNGGGHIEVILESPYKGED